jgi:hypothetical protein
VPYFGGGVRVTHDPPFLRQSDRDALSDIRAEVAAIAKRATETRRRLEQGEAVTGISGLIEIENHCRDALALFDTFAPW